MSEEQLPLFGDLAAPSSEQLERYVREEWQVWWEAHCADYPEGLDVYSAWEAGFSAREVYPWDPHLWLSRWLLTQPLPPELEHGTAAEQAVGWIQRLRELLAPTQKE